MSVTWTSEGDYEDIRYEVSGDGIAKITIDRPEVRNAFRPQTVIELAEAFETGDFETAAAAYQKILDEEPANEQAKAALAQVTFLARAEAADPSVVVRADTSPEDIEAQLSAADVELANQRIEQAFKRLLDVIRRTAGPDRDKARTHLVELFGLFPAEDPLVAMVPVSVRTEEQMGTYGNRVSAMTVPIPTDEPDPRRRLLRTHEIMKSAKTRHNALPADLMTDATAFMPPTLASRAARMTMETLGRTRPPLNLVISNVPGPRTPLFCAGARLEANYPVSVVVDGVGLNITVMSYRDHLDFGIITDRDAIDDPWPLLQGHAEALQDRAGKTADAEFQPFHILDGLDFLAEETTHLCAGIASRKADTIVLREKLDHHVLAIAEAQPCVHLASIGAEGECRAKGEDRILAPVVV